MILPPNGNWVDFVLILLFLYVIYDSFGRKFWESLAEFASFLGSLLFSFGTYQFVASFLSANFFLPTSFAKPVGFIITALVSEIAIGFLITRIILSLPEKIFKSSITKVASILPALGQAVVIATTILVLVVALPIRPSIKKDVADSRIGGYLLKNAVSVEKNIREIFGEAIEDSLTYFTIKPGSREVVHINVEKAELSVDSVSETTMFKLVNDERAKRGIQALSWEPAIVPVAKAHARDMWEREYFSHYSPEGKDVGDRLTEAGIAYRIAGENLAMAPTVSVTHQGLMNSEGHKANILEPRFRKLGIGVIDNGYYGKMLVQIFTD